jgi:hypothetical protein
VWALRGKWGGGDSVIDSAWANSSSSARWSSGRGITEEKPSKTPGRGIRTHAGFYATKQARAAQAAAAARRDRPPTEASRMCACVQRPPPFLHVRPCALWLECGPVEKKKRRPPSRQRATWLSACRRRAKRPSSGLYVRPAAALLPVDATHIAAVPSTLAAISANPPAVARPTGV